MLYVYDAAYEPNLSAVKANGGIAVARYFVGSNPSLQWKRVTPAQVAAIHAAGLGVVVNYEGSADPIAQAHSAGISLRTFGQMSANAALEDIKACGIAQDGTVACYFSLDTNYGQAQFADLEQLAHGWHDVMDPARIQVKAYGDGAALKHLISVGLVDGKQWLAAPSSWPGFDPNDDVDFCMVQLVGSPVSATDQDVVHTVSDAKAIGASWPAGSPYAIALSAGNTGGVFMALSDAQQADLLTKVTDLHNWLANGTAAGQVNEGGTIAATLGTAQGVVNLENQELAMLRALSASLDPSKFAAAVVAALPAQPATGGLTQADVEAAVQAVFAKAAA